MTEGATTGRAPLRHRAAATRQSLASPAQSADSTLTIRTLPLHPCGFRDDPAALRNDPSA
jgi:hypothetical protein